MLAQGGFKGMGNGKALGLWNDFTNFNKSTSTSYGAPWFAKPPFWMQMPQPSSPGGKK